MMQISSSIVLYKNDRAILSEAINSFLNLNLPFVLYLVDNSPTDDLNNIVSDYRVEYIHNPTNPGFGAAHNIAIGLAIQSGYKYHFIVNPDTYFDTDVVTPMVNYMENHSDVGMMMPQILNNDGTIQFLPKLLPSVYWIFRRKFKKIDFAYNDFINKYELRNVPINKIYNVPILSGCFTLLNLKAIEEIGYYDDRFFMYFEDFDLSRRMHQKYKTIYFPEVSVYHGYEGGANKSLKLFKVFIRSMIAYFNKWGWFSDKHRKRFNRKALSQF